MSLLTRIKLVFAVVVASVVGILYAMLGVKNKKLDDARENLNQANSKAESMKKVIESHEKRLQIEDDMAGNGTNPDRLSNDQYNRD